MRREIAVIFAVALAMALPAVATAAQPDIRTEYSVPLIVNEGLPGFILPQPTIEIPKGIARFTTFVPETAKGSHGIGITGGVYKNILGAHVKPGRSSSLTVSLSPGDYTVFDSYKQNRANGYAVRVHVKKSPIKRVSYGKRCGRASIFELPSTIWVKNVSCASAQKLKESVDQAWADKGYSYEPIVEREFTCIFNPVSSIGLKTACIAGNARVTWTG